MDNGDSEQVKMSPVYSGSEENERFFKATPWGDITLGVVNKGLFVQGGEYYVDFTPSVSGETHPVKEPALA